MLGRLIKQHSLSNLTTAPSPTPQKQALGASCNYDDSHMRDILYALRAVSQSAAPFDGRRFRLVVGQDGGNLRAKQVLYDAEHRKSPDLRKAANERKSPDPKPGRSGMAPTTAPGSPSGTGTWPIIPAAELADYMFGRGIPTNEVATATKVHVLYLAQGPPAVLVTKLFLLVDKYADLDDVHPDWNPTPTWPASHTASGFQATGPELSCRFSLGVVMPLDDHTVEDVLATVWPVLARHLAVLQKLVARKLVAALRLATVDGSCPYVMNRRIVFPLHLLDSDPDLVFHTLKLARAVQFVYNTPRLMDTHTLMQSTGGSQSQYRFFLISWAAEVVNWLEFKDGRTTPLFLASLITAVLSLRDQSECSTAGGQSVKEKAAIRVVVMTGNSPVAKRLMFILNGFFRCLGLDALCLLPGTESRIPESRTPIQEQRSSVSDYRILTQDTRFSPHEPRSSVRALFSSKFSSPHKFKSLMDDDDPRDNRPPAAAPIPIRSISPALRAPSTQESSLSLLRPIPINGHHMLSLKATVGSSGSGLQTLGWEIPTKSGASLWASSSGAPHAAMHTSSSTACLSTSLNSLSSSASNYSLSKLGGSFIEKWRLLFVPHEEGDPPKRPALTWAKTPPALEEEPWDFLSPRQRLSRTQSMLNLADQEPVHSVRRDNTAVYTDALEKPSNPESEGENDNEDPASESVGSINQSRIRQKCRSIMQSPINHTTSLLLNAVVVPAASPCGLVRRKILLPNVAFVEEFRPEFVLQSCPINPKLESAVINYMKNDLVFSQSCGYNKVASRTIFVNLPAREAKLIELVTEPPLTDSQDAKAPHTNFRTSIKKVVAPGRSLVEKTKVERVGNQLRQLTEIVDSINNGGEGVGQSKRDPFNQLLFQTVLELIR